MRNKLKIDTRGKQYPLKDSIFYKLKSKKKLASILGFPLSKIYKLKDDSNYHCFEDFTGKKPRSIQHPIRDLEVLHTRIASLLTRIEPPEYIHSGRKGRSHITNALTHLNAEMIFATDIKSFFPSTKRSHIFHFFKRHLMTSRDVAGLMAELCTWNGVLPTGSRISMPIAFLANLPMFRELENLADKHELRFTVFVDDLTYSGKRIDGKFKEQVRKTIASYGHIMHPRKTKIYKPNDYKIVTGVALKDGTAFVTNHQHKEIYQDIEMWKAILKTHHPPLQNRLMGRLNSQSLIDPRLKNKSNSIRNSTKY
jgi:hypothetical protein